MSVDRTKFDDEIDLFAFFEKLWNGKWKIIATTFFSALIGFVYIVNKPNSFSVSTPINHGSQSVFLAYTSLNNLLKENRLLYDKKLNINGYEFNSRVVFNMFVTEFNDYEEMIDALSENDYVIEHLKGVEGISRQRELIQFAKSFMILPPKNKNLQWLLKFQWHDDREGIKLFNKAIKQTLLNIQKTSKTNMDKLADAIEIQNSRVINNLNKELEISGKKQALEDKKRLQYLGEQFVVAKALGIKTNKLSSDAFADSSQLSFFFLKKQNEVPNINTVVPQQKNIPYFLLGYKAIKKEIAIIKERTDNERLVTSPRYVDIKNRIISIESDLTSNHLRSASKLIENDNPQNWVQFDLELADIKSEKRTIMYILLFLILGGVLGSIYVLVSHSILMRKHNSV